MISGNGWISCKEALSQKWVWRKAEGDILDTEGAIKNFEEVICVRERIYDWAKAWSKLSDVYDDSISKITSPLHVNYEKAAMFLDAVKTINKDLKRIPDDSSKECDELPFFDENDIKLLFWLVEIRKIAGKNGWNFEEIWNEEDLKAFFDWIKRNVDDESIVEKLKKQLDSMKDFAIPSSNNTENNVQKQICGSAHN